MSLLPIVGMTFLSYVTIGLPLAVLPAYVAQDLGFGLVWAGVAVSAQYVATVAARAQTGRVTDRFGARLAVTWGNMGTILAGGLTLLALWASAAPLLSLVLLLAGRLALGFGESWVSTGALTWAVGRFGPRETVRIISWNGIASYGGVACGAPLGAFIAEGYGFEGIAVATAALGLLGLVMARLQRDAPRQSGQGIGSWQVLRRVAPYGIALAFAACGFGAVLSFIALFYQGKGWGHAPMALSALGFGFIAVRLFLANVMTRVEALALVQAAILVEVLGLALIFWAPAPFWGVAGAALIGAGFSPLFPALGTAAMNRAPVENRGTALGFYSAFLDVSLCIAGPLAGGLAAVFGGAAPFALGMVTGLLSLALCRGLRRASGMA
ncbi:MFS transporter [Acetobacteraceae bacterium H6797]|nr:MFS transporter [Acetobacteraceae bacterium H6797]